MGIVRLQLTMLGHSNLNSGMDHLLQDDFLSQENGQSLPIRTGIAAFVGIHILAMRRNGSHVCTCFFFQMVQINPSSQCQLEAGHILRLQLDDLGAVNT